MAAKNNPPGFDDKDKLIKEWREATAQHPRFLELSAGYLPSTVSGWLDHFAGEKFRWLQGLERNEKRHEEDQLQWINQAGEHLEIILQKKLFDLQCRWRAEAVQLPGVDIAFDFEVWEYDVFNCPFLEPVTAADVELYQQYLYYEDAEPIRYHAPGSLDRWQNYDKVKAMLNEPDGEINLPPWFQYHNQFTSAGMLMRSLPDIRGGKEAYYRNICRNGGPGAQEVTSAADGALQDDRPVLLYYFNKEFLSHIMATEPEQVRRAHRLYEWAVQYVDEAEDIIYMTNELLRAEEPVPVEAHANWYEALVETSRRYRCRMIAEALPQAFEQYQMTIQMGIGFPRDEKQVENWRHIRQIWAETVIKGRELLGEPGDFNF